MRAFTIMLLAMAGAAHAAVPAYVISKTILLGSPDRWDYVSFDRPSNRVFVAHSDHTDVIDASTGAALGKLLGLNGAHGQAVSADGTVWAVSGKTAQITAFDPTTFMPIRTLPAGTGADGVISDPDGRLIVVLDGEADSATLIDARSRTVKATIPLGGSPEFAAADATGHLYVNIESTKEVVAIDLPAGRVIARYPVPDCLSPHGLAIDTTTRRLFTSCANARLQVLNPDSGQVLQTLPIGRGTDAAVFDPVRHRVYSANGEGTLSVFQETRDGALTALGDVKTAPGARTMALDPSTGRIFLVTAEPAAVQPPPAGGRSHIAYKPGTVRLMFLDSRP